MKQIKSLTSACKHCRYYDIEGRRGGFCQQLGAPVRGSWKACSLAIPAFAPSWENLEDVWSLSDATLVLASGLNNPALDPVEETAAPCSFEKAKAEAVLI
ncbi:MAG: hypothetical protein KME49_13140 [Brasilonema octagenarum HA4186-MV1]|jgi:hypothetical protein|uniref:Uncharacterized protein n=2 Tax=Brasilonema TaxID=383614 RepID=A0A856MM92_9CYAN|nr:MULTISPECIES: hypothetical protein [Brasilonema]MBW4626411.1 hypothetical protein [Brasilonema octagenarum HA4186-MV1]NMF66348.1 hypothetical protein [Brasilonema octagenarum UFV-OR1]QDL11642.1 hypothetical protein DP114_30455 [Brasilonema sennae CENA114]QDL18022.1 hypothetical protein DP113_30595 [Brasilonema octagenarum UFV-E1]